MFIVFSRQAKVETPGPYDTLAEAETVAAAAAQGQPGKKFYVLKVIKEAVAGAPVVNWTVIP